MKRGVLSHLAKGLASPAVDLVQYQHSAESLLQEVTTAHCGFLAGVEVSAIVTLRCRKNCAEWKSKQEKFRNFLSFALSRDIVEDDTKSREILTIYLPYTVHTLIKYTRSLEGTFTLAASNLLRLAPCTCRPLQRQFYSTTSTYYTANPTPSTSALVVEDVPAFQQLLGPDTRIPTASTSQQHRRRRSKRLLSFRPLPLVTTLAPRTRIPREPIPHPSQISPYLPLITRERNFLLSILRQNLYSPTPDPENVWKSLVPVLEYPATLPTLPPSFHPLSELAGAAEDDFEDPRRRIQLSLFELRRAFNILSRSTPRTRSGLSRLLVIVELLAMRVIPNLPPAEDTLTGARDQQITELRGGGIGLREKDWRALIMFAAFSYRSPRATHEVSAATTLFSQWSKSNTVGKVSPKVTTQMFNVLLNIATESRSWALMDGIEERMKREGASGDLHTVGILIKRDDSRGTPVIGVWVRFEEGLMRFRSLTRNKFRENRAVLWNGILWVIVKRGMMEDGMRIYSAMRKAEPVPLHTLAPRQEDNSDETASSISSNNPFWIVPPPPTQETYSMLIQAYAHRGDLKSALRILRDMVTPALTISNSANAVPLPTYTASTRIFGVLFRGFAKHGVGYNDASLDSLLLSGGRVGLNSSARYTDTFSVLRRPTSLVPSFSSDVVNPWTLSSLSTLYQAFLSLSPPHTQGKERLLLPFSGERTAPSSQQIFWLLLAFQKLSGGDWELVWKVWEEVQRTFGGSEGEGRDKWTGWRVDGLLRRKVEEIEGKLNEARKLREEMGLEGNTTVFDM